MTEKTEEIVEVKQEVKEILPGFENFEQFTKEGYKVLIGAIKQSGSLPSGGNWNFYNAHDAFKTILANEGSKLLTNINTILSKNNIGGNIKNRGLEEKTELVIDANDCILEKVADNIDEMNGIKKKSNEPVLIQTVSAQLPVNGSWNRANNPTFSVSSSLASQSTRRPTANAIRLLTAKNIERPQKAFKDKIINSSSFPWEPRIKEKPNSLKPLAILLEQYEDREEYSHPYEYELDRFVPPADQLLSEEPITPKPIESTPLYEINQPEQVEGLVETLRGCKEFAVDLEHHSYRSFMGITCLMQISTRDADYIIDTLALRDKLYMLNEVFTKPSILKIFHGAECDIQWLQRDLSIYVINMFDTYQASRILGYSGRSLAYLIERFCNFAPNKQFQLADWRIRPLPEELKQYARGDTHYLIYIYQMMKNDLIRRSHGDDNLLKSVFNESTETCKKRYFKPHFKEDSYLDFYRKCKRLFDNRQLYALKELYKWRDGIAREEDESTGYVLPNHMLLQISEALPREMQGILACCNPIPPLVRSNLLELHKIVLRAREQPLQKTIMKEDTRARGTTKKISKINVDSPIHCPHDLTKTQEFRDDLPILLGGKFNEIKNLLDQELPVQKQHSMYSVFNIPDTLDNELSSETKKKLDSISFLGPFDRYKLVKPYIQAEEQRLAEEKSKEEEERAKARAAEGNSQQKTSEESTAQTDARTDEERIESIRQHFLSLSRLPAWEEMAAQNHSLVQMGGTKKRKRDDSSPAEEEVDNSAADFSITIPDNSYQSNRKRKSGDQIGGVEKQRKLGGNDAEKKNRKKQNKGQNHNKSVNRNSQHNNRNNQDRNRKNKEQVTNFEVSVENERLSGNVNIHYQTSTQNMRNTPNKKQKGKFRNKDRNNRNSPATQTQNVQEDFEPFDYASVDFRQFQGGASKAVNIQNAKSKFVKGKKMGGNKNNKSFTFGGSGRGRGGGRGRGRGGGRGRGR
ncbi:unnamed protein product [Acanthoscelides obtectus]|uniref:Exosome complex component 10 homolog n=1 Tax=Acanthoscelides obtectus TaxID=200917 RepID=A0A9P0L1A7_ACAOB|nr:unnamed protein product [Acanthoscelides obtectus]CAK1677088.1 Exosome component 10 [Acanthoscelides obtectus]